jgi:DNA polymerase-4
MILAARNGVVPGTRLPEPRLGRTVTVKIKWADFQQATRSQSLARPIDSLASLHQASLGPIRSVFPPPKGVRLVGVTVSNFLATPDAPQADSMLLSGGVAA